MRVRVEVLPIAQASFLMDTVGKLVGFLEAIALSMKSTKRLQFARSLVIAIVSLHVDRGELHWSRCHDDKHVRSA